jgi:hypothetical protein
MEKNRGDEPIQAIIHIYMEMSQWNNLYSYLKQMKMENRKVKQILSGVGTSGGGGYKERV